jgi:hypothetical protein
MNRKQFLATIAKTGAGAVAVGALSRWLDATNSSAFTLERSGVSPDFVAKRVVTDHVAHLPFPQEAIFPLLCPVREYEWLDGWQCTMIYSKSGVAEENCVFLTNHNGRPAIWSCNRYEPSKRIEFVTIVAQTVVTRLNISLEQAHGGTNLRWERIFTGLSEEGNATLGVWKTERDADLSHRLEYYLKTGTMLREDHARG